jgi:His-Xaa-Ser system protein HxsD
MTAESVAREGPMRLVVIDPKVYSLNAVLKTAYWFTDRAFLHLQFGGDQKIELRLRAKHPGADVESLAGDFMNELLDQQLREAVAAETEGIRDLIFSHALSKTSLLQRDLETADPFSDPRHVGSCANPSDAQT